MVTRAIFSPRFIFGGQGRRLQAKRARISGTAPKPGGPVRGTICWRRSAEKGELWGEVGRRALLWGRDFRAVSFNELVSAVATAPQGTLPVGRAPADMRPCNRCGRTDPRRMIALMTLWFGPPAGLIPEPGYFYLCPSCYQACIAPLSDVIVHRLTEHHPVGHKPGRLTEHHPLDRKPGHGAAPAAPDDLAGDDNAPFQY